MTSREDLIREADALYDAVGYTVFREEFRKQYIERFEQSPAYSELHVDLHEDEREGRIEEALSFFAPEARHAAMTAFRLGWDHALLFARRTVQGELPDATDFFVDAVESWFDEYNGTDPGVGGWYALEVNIDAMRAALRAAAAGREEGAGTVSASYINPALPSMIRRLYRADLREKSIQNMLDLAADLVQELIDLRAEQGTEEPEWEYECDRVAAGFGGRIRIADPEEHRKQCSGRIYRRRKAGSWTPVEQEPDQATNHEIRRQS